MRTLCWHRNTSPVVALTEEFEAKVAPMLVSALGFRRVAGERVVGPDEMHA
jgi:hypothetical protein